MTKICVKCGEALVDDIRFCEACGTFVSFDEMSSLDAEAAIHSRRESQYQTALAWDGITCMGGFNLSGRRLRSAALAQADMCHCNLQEADLSESDLHGANLAGAWLQACNLSKVDLRRATLCGAHLDCTSLQGARLEGARLENASLEEADLISADLREADLSGANLFRANLTDADLRGAFLYRVNLALARVSEEQLKTAWVLLGAILPDGSRYDGRYRLEGDNNWAYSANVDLTDKAERVRFYTNVDR